MPESNTTQSIYHMMMVILSSRHVTIEWFIIVFKEIIAMLTTDCMIKVIYV